MTPAHPGETGYEEVQRHEFHERQRSASSPAIPDPAESQTPVRERPQLHRVGNWDTARWIQFIRDHPDCTLPGGVAALLVQEIDRLTPKDFITINPECFQKAEP